MTRTQALTKKWQIKVDLHQKSHEIQILESSKTSQMTKVHSLRKMWQIKFMYRKKFTKSK